MWSVKGMYSSMTDMSATAMPVRSMLIGLSLEWKRIKKILIYIVKNFGRDKNAILKFYLALCLN